MRLLITTKTHDAHVMPVSLWMRDRGHEVNVLHGADFPDRQKISLTISPLGDFSLVGKDQESYFNFSDFNVVWNRRHTPFQLPEDLHPADQEFVRRECQHYTRGFWQLVGQDAFWVNDEPAAVKARSKPMQMLEAQRIGLRIPETLMSNDPDEIRKFLSYGSGEVIYKAFTQTGHWVTKIGVSSADLFTSKIKITDLPTDNVLQKTPGIFQHLVPKAYEVRATFMGATCLAVRIDSQGTDSGKMDWRRLQGEGAKLPLTSVTLPNAVYEDCRKLMQRLGIVFGCFDFIVTPDNEYIFLEVNEMGQFLWVEDCLPEIPMLDAFCHFLLSENPEFHYQPQGTISHVKDYFESELITEMRQRDLNLHISPPFENPVEDEEGDPSKAVGAS